MKLRVKLFAVAKDLANRDALDIDLPSGATIADLQTRIMSDYPALSSVLPHALWAVDTEYAAADTRLHERSDVVLIPPVSGG